MGLFDKRVVECNSKLCGAEDYIAKIQTNFESIAEKLTEGQIQMQIHLAKLTESIGGLKKLEDKVDKNSQLVWKMVGIGMAAAALAPVVIQKFLL